MGRLLTLAFLAVLPMLAWGEGYVCVPDMGVGLRYSLGTWQEGRLTPDASMKFVVRRPKEIDGTGVSEAEVIAGALGIPHTKWIVEMPSTRSTVAACPEDFDSGGRLICHRAEGEFRFNKNSLRFLHVYLGAYWDSTSDKESDQPITLAIGKCSPM